MKKHKKWIKLNSKAFGLKTFSGLGPVFGYNIYEAEVKNVLISTILENEYHWALIPE